MRKYIQFNTCKRTQAKNDEKDLEKQASKATFVSAKMLNNNLFAINKIKDSNKSLIPTGQTLPAKGKCKIIIHSHTK